MNTKPTKSVYKYAADGGLYVGACLSLMSLCLVASLKVPMLPLLIFPLGIVLMLVTGKLMRDMARETPSYSSFSALWLFGIYSFLFGSLIAAMVTTLYLQFIEPDFFRQYLLNALEMAQQANLNSAMQPTINEIHSILEQHRLPSRMQFVFSMMWTSCFFGSIISLGIAAVVKSIVKGKFNVRPKL